MCTAELAPHGVSAHSLQCAHSIHRNSNSVNIMMHGHCRACIRWCQCSLATMSSLYPSQCSSVNVMMHVHRRACTTWRQCSLATTSSLPMSSLQKWSNTERISTAPCKCSDGSICKQKQQAIMMEFCPNPIYANVMCTCTTSMYAVCKPYARPEGRGQMGKTRGDRVCQMGKTRWDRVSWGFGSQPSFPPCRHQCQPAKLSHWQLASCSQGRVAFYIF
eukprot:957574-Pelagomonas_calceolata.AAC.2